MEDNCVVRVTLLFPSLIHTHFERWLHLPTLRSANIWVFHELLLVDIKIYTFVNGSPRKYGWTFDGVGGRRDAASSANFLKIRQ